MHITGPADYNYPLSIVAAVVGLWLMAWAPGRAKR